VKLKSVEEILEFAVRREEEEAKFYGRFAERAASGGMKLLLYDLEREEQKHKKLLEEIASGKAVPLVLENIPDLKISDYALDEPVDAESNFQDLLIFAAKKEARAAALYEQLGRHALSPEHKRLFEFLVQQEKSHKLKLEQEYEKHVLQED
jgi:rubrerythrin